MNALARQLKVAAMVATPIILPAVFAAMAVYGWSTP
jgi:hypothetical protein